MDQFLQIIMAVVPIGLSYWIGYRRGVASEQHRKYMAGLAQLECRVQRLERTGP